MINKDHSQLSIRDQCKILEISRSGLYRTKSDISPFNQMLMREIDEEYTQHPFLGVIKMTHYLRNRGFRVNPKRIRRLMRLMNLVAIYPKPNLSLPNKSHEHFPYLLRGLKVDRVNQVWSIDITYIRTANGFCYLTAIIDWYSRYVVAWELSNTLDVDFCKTVLREALSSGRPEIFNMDQGSQFTSTEFLDILREDTGLSKIQISMDGKGRALDNVFVERLWRSVKYEEVYLRNYQGMLDAQEGLSEYFRYYNNDRPHQSLAYAKPISVHFNGNVRQKLIA